MQAMIALFGFLSMGLFRSNSNWDGTVDDATTGDDDLAEDVAGDEAEVPFSGEPLIRLTEASYEDGIGSLDADAPNARSVSNAVAQQTEDMPNTDDVSNLFWAWGQFIDHDISLTSTTGDEFSPIPVTDFDDPEFEVGGIIPFTRIEAVEGSGETTPRAYENEITSLMDASMVYGSNAEAEAALRDGAYLRMAEADDLMVETDHGVLAGDARAAENVALTSMHTLFAREHNHLVDELAAANPDLDEDELFEMARLRVEIQVQAITYNEWLPMLVGEDAIADYQGFDPEETSAVAIEFSTAAFRFGHTLLPTELERVNEDGTPIEDGSLALRDAFFNASAIADGGGIDPLLAGLAGSNAQELDNMVVEDVRSFLLGEDGTTGLDLAALNIERGRDLGIPKYNDLREQLGLERIEDFSDISTDPDVVVRLEIIYDDVDDIDAWVGGLAEDPVEGGIIGETFSTVIVDQFERIRDADPDWAESTTSLSDEEFEALWSTTLSDVIQKNSGVENLQEDAFIAYDRIGGTDDDDEVIGTEENDLLIGFDGDDAILGGAGDDHIVGGVGNDTLSGGEGADLFTFAAGDGVDVISDLNVEEDRISIDIEDTEVDISALFLPVDAGGYEIALGEGDSIFVLGDDDIDEDDLARAIELV